MAEHQWVSGCSFFILKEEELYEPYLITGFWTHPFFGVDEHLRNPGIHHQYTDVCVIAKKSCGYIKES